MKNRLLITLTLLLVILGSTKAQFVNYEDDKGWNLGFNFGGVWQQNDFKYTPRAGFSGGFTFGKSLYEKEGAFLAFDLRFRYLGGWDRGWSLDSSTIVLPTDTFSGYNNYRLSLHEYTLEGVLTLNRLRERTGILLYGFGGVGLTNYVVKANYYDANSSVYDYSSLDNSKNPNLVVDDLKTITDETYETTVKERGVDFMPSLGIGIGYQFPYHFSIGVEHKITYALGDNKLNGMPNGINDKYHYSAVYFRWNLFGRGGETYTVDNTTNTNSNSQVNNYTTVTPTTTVPTGNKPLVNIVNPIVNNQTVQNSNFTISANIYYVANSNKIIFKQNGIQLNNFNFNPSTNQFNAAVVLQPGNNVFEIIGSNNYGSDQDSKIIILQNIVQTIPPPIVTITNPPYCPFTVESPSFVLTSTILNVENVNQIAFKFNGVNATNFSFNPTTKVFSAGLTLKEGNNTVEITATNTRGSVTKSCVINHVVKKELPPVVHITYPNNNPYNTTNPITNITGTVENIIYSSQITVSVNGTNQSNFTYNSGTKQVAFPANLILGANVIQISATNNVGADSKSTTIIYTKPEILPPPVVTYVIPSVSPFNTAMSNMTIKATVLNVSGKSFITVKHNGNSVSNFSYSPVTKLVSYNANLLEGSNVFEIKGTNASGNDVEVATVIYKRPILVRPPIVTITNPTTTPFMTNSATEQISATILNVSNANNVTATFNGISVSNFVFNPSTNAFSYTANLVLGANTLLVTGTNSAGTASKTQTIFYSVPPCEKPTLTRVAPITNPQTTSNSKGYLEYQITGATSVVFKINGQTSPGYNFSQVTGKFTSMLHLTEGATSYEVTATNSCGSVSQTTTIIYEAEIPCYNPVIHFTNPSTSPFEHVGKTGNTSFSANVSNVSASNMIAIKLNGTTIPFTFDANSGTVSGTMLANQGTNIISISATNECGTTSSETVITYQGIQNQLPPPLVTITSPSENPYATSSTSQTITATILNVSGASNISAIFNGMAVSNFTYNAASKVFSYNANLVDGLNTLVISGTNSVGTDTKTQTINYALPCSDPTVSFAKPMVNATGTTSFFATVSNVTNQNMVIVTQNGTSIPFTYNSSTGLISVTITLVEGDNVISISATNACGNDVSTHTIIYNAPVEPPCVNPRIRIASASTSDNTVYNFAASVSDITDANNVVVKLNGNVVPSTFVLSNGSLTASITLEVGNNTIVVQANECDGATESMNVTYTIPCDPVTYSLIAPSENNVTSSSETYSVRLNTSNVSTNSNVNVSLNGSSLPFTFDNNSGLIVCPNILLQEGSNSIVVTISNDCSTESVSYSVEYSAPVVQQLPPIISFTATTKLTSYNDPLVVEVKSVNGIGSVVNYDNSTFTVSIDGANVTNFTYSNGAFSIPVSFTTHGETKQVVATATNPAGTDSKTIYVRYNDPNYVAPDNGNSTNTSDGSGKPTEGPPGGNGIEVENDSDNEEEEGSQNSDGSHANETALNNQYNSAIAKADMYFNAKKWATAKTHYQQALNVKPKEKYPKQRLAEIENKLKVNTGIDAYTTKPNNTTTIKTDPNAQKYTTAIKKADMYFNAKKWTTAKTYYKQALMARPNDGYAKGKLTTIAAKMKPSNIVKPTNTTKPNHTTKPNNTKPNNVGKPNNTTKPNNTVKPSSTKPSGGSKTGGGSRGSKTTRPVSTRPKPTPTKPTPTKTETKKEKPAKTMVKPTTVTPTTVKSGGQRGGR